MLKGQDCLWKRIQGLFVHSWCGCRLFVECGLSCWSLWVDGFCFAAGLDKAALLPADGAGAAGNFFVFDFTAYGCTSYAA